MPIYLTGDARENVLVHGSSVVVVLVVVVVVVVVTYCPLMHTALILASQSSLYIGYAAVLIT